MGAASESFMPCPNFKTPAKDLTYKDLLTSIFTQADHGQGYQNLARSGNVPWVCLFAAKSSDMTWCRSNVTWTPTLEKQLARKGLSQRAENLNHKLLRRVNFFVFNKHDDDTSYSSNYNTDGSPEAADLSWVLLEKKKAWGRQGWSGRNL